MIKKQKTTVKKEEMDIFFSMFNSHINNAFEKAKENFIENFGIESWNENIGIFEKNGIMQIFDFEPNELTIWFASMVQCYVNEEVS